MIFNLTDLPKILECPSISKNFWRNLNNFWSRRSCKDPWMGFHLEDRPKVLGRHLNSKLFRRSPNDLCWQRSFEDPWKTFDLEELPNIFKVTFDLDVPKTFGAGVCNIQLQYYWSKISLKSIYWILVDVISTFANYCKIWNHGQTNVNYVMSHISNNTMAITKHELFMSINYIVYQFQIPKVFIKLEEHLLF